jgi:hypothetical protein
MVLVLVREEDGIDRRKPVQIQRARRIDAADRACVTDLFHQQRVDKDAGLVGREEPALMTEECCLHNVSGYPTGALLTTERMGREHGGAGILDPEHRVIEEEAIRLDDAISEGLRRPGSPPSAGMSLAWGLRSLWQLRHVAPNSPEKPSIVAARRLVEVFVRKALDDLFGELEPLLLGGRVLLILL